MSFIKIILGLFLMGFIYHISSFIMHLFRLSPSIIHILSALLSLILFGVCFYLCKNVKTYDDNHHNINKIR